MNQAIIVAGLLAAAALPGCSSLELLERDQVVEFKDCLDKIQYYSSGEIILSRVLRSEERKVSHRHHIRIEMGKRIEEIIISAHTPGVLAEKGSDPPDLLLVHFETPTPTNALAFRYNPKDQAYHLDTDDWKVAYEGKEYEVVKQGGLLIDVRKIRETKRKQRVLPGVKLAR